MLFEEWIEQAYSLGASDLHIEPWENSIAVRARVNCASILSEEFST